VASINQKAIKPIFNITYKFYIIMKAVNTNINKVATKKVVTKKASNYKANVLDANKELKQETKTLKGSLQILKILSKNQQVVDACEKVDYPKLKKVCRKSKAGNYSPFFVLQALYKLELTK